MARVRLKGFHSSKEFSFLNSFWACDVFDTEVFTVSTPQRNSHF